MITFEVYVQIWNVRGCICTMCTFINRMFANVFFHLKHSECEHMWNITFMIYIHVLTVLERYSSKKTYASWTYMIVYVHFLHSYFER